MRTHRHLKNALVFALQGKSHTVAVRALANVWARILYAVWKKKELYQTTTFELARLAHAPRVA